MTEQLMDEVARLVAEATRPGRLNQIDDVMARLGVGRSTVFGLMASGRLKSVKIGRRRLVPEQALTDFIATLSG
jgi:excisionase family DNA binding protein